MRRSGHCGGRYPSRNFDGQVGTAECRHDRFGTSAKDRIAEELVGTGRKPFAGRNLDEIVQAVQKGDPVPARELCPGVPPDLSAIAARAMAVDPERRFANAREMAVALRAWQIRATAPMRLTPAFDPLRQPHERGEPASAGDSRVPATTARWLALLGLAVAGALLWQLR